MKELIKEIIDCLGHVIILLPILFIGCGVAYELFWFFVEIIASHADRQSKNDREDGPPDHHDPFA